MSDDLDLEDEAHTSDGKPRPNKANKPKKEASVESVAAAELRQFIERLERLEEEKATIAEDFRSVMSEAKGRGYDTKAIRAILRLRKKDENERMEEQAVLDTYMAALGMRVLDSIGEDDD